MQGQVNAMFQSFAINNHESGHDDGEEGYEYYLYPSPIHRKALRIADQLTTWRDGAKHVAPNDFFQRPTQERRTTSIPFWLF